MIAFTARGHTWIPAAAGAIDSLASLLYRLALTGFPALSMLPNLHM